MVISMLQAFDIETAFSTLSVDYNSQIIFTVIFLVFWIILYKAVYMAFNWKQLSIKESNDIKRRIGPIVHGIITFWLATYEYLPFPVFDQPNTNFQTLICIFSLTFFIYDTLICFSYKLLNFSVTSHHLFCIIGWCWILLDGYGAINGIGGLFVTEISNFYMHFRTILKTFNKKYTKSYEYSQNICFATFIFFRGIIGPIFVWYPFITSLKCPLVATLMFTALEVQSFYYIFQMIGIIKKKLEKYQQIKQKSVKLEWLIQNPEQLQKLSFYKKKQVLKMF